MTAYRYKWLRVDRMGQPNTQGWEPVPDDELPRSYGAEDTDILDPSIAGETGGLRLHRMPEGLAAVREEYYQRKNALIAQSPAENWLRNNDPRMPKFAEAITDTHWTPKIVTPEFLESLPEYLTDAAEIELARCYIEDFCTSGRGWEVDPERLAVANILRRRLREPEVPLNQEKSG
jgi:hypothetical protein